MGKLNSWIALLRAIGPATHRKMSMQQLRDACEARGLSNIRTYIASGNLLFDSTKSMAELTLLLDEVMAGHDLDNKVFLRKPKELQTVVDALPFPDAAASRPNHLLVVFLERAPTAKQVEALMAYSGPELIEVSKREVYIDYVGGVAGSKLTPALIERRLGRPGTARNWNTLKKLITLSQ